MSHVIFSNFGPVNTSEDNNKIDKKRELSCSLQGPVAGLNANDDDHSKEPFILLFPDRYSKYQIPCKFASYYFHIAPSF
jgi:hypothetical protein